MVAQTMLLPCLSGFGFSLGREILSVKDYSDWRDGIIRDGFERRAYLSESEGYHQELRFSYRPYLAEQVAEIEAKKDLHTDRGDAAKARGELIKALDGSLRSWSLKLRNGDAIELNLANIRRVPLLLQTKIYNIVTGFAPTEIDPQWRGTEEEDDDDGLPPLESVADQVGKS